MNPPPRTISQAADIAKRVLNTGKATEVYLIGANAAGQPSARGISLLLAVSERQLNAFFGLLRSTSAGFGGYATSLDRLNAASLVLDWDTEELATLFPGTLLDVFLVPQNWLTNLVGLEHRFRSPVPKFWRSASVTARRFNAVKGEFEEVPAALQVYEQDGLLYTYSAKLGCAVVMVDEPVPPKRIITLANDVGAINPSHKRNRDFYAVEFLPQPGQSSAPRFYTSAALSEALAQRFPNPVS